SKSRNFRDLSLPLFGLYLLAAPSTPQEARDEIIERAQAGETIPVAEAKRIIEHAKDQQQPRKRTKPQAAQPPPRDDIGPASARAYATASKNCKPRSGGSKSRSARSKARSRKRRPPPSPHRRASRHPDARSVTRKSKSCCGPFLSVTTASTSTKSAKPRRLMTASTSPKACGGRRRDDRIAGWPHD